MARPHSFTGLRVGGTPRWARYLREVLLMSDPKSGNGWSNSRTA